MRHGKTSLIAFAGLATAVVWLAPGALLAQTAKPAARASNPTRSADGHPDLQGTYDVATITPVERPPGLGTRLVLTDQEATALEAYEKQRRDKGAEPSAADRNAPPVGGDVSTVPPGSFLEFVWRLGGGTVGGYNTFWLASGDQVATVNGQKRSSLIVDPPEGTIPPMTPEAMKRNRDLLAVALSPDAAEAASTGGPPSSFDDPELRPLAERCILGFGSTSGPPALPNYFYNNLKQIVQTPKFVVILNEMIHDARVVRMGGEHLPPHIRKWMGDSVGHWEGDTLVVDTTNFTDKTRFRGSSEKLHVIERFSRLDASTLLYRFTVEDPTTWTRPWTGEYTWRATDEHLYEYACHEGNYSLGNILRGARLKEVDDTAKRSAKP